MTAMALDRRTHMQLAMTIILTGVLGASVLSALRSLGRAAPRHLPLIPSVAARSQAPTGGLRPRATPSDQITYTAYALPDPMQERLPQEPKPAAVEPRSAETGTVAVLPVPAPLPPLRIQGLVWGGARPTVIIGDEVYGVGDEVQGAAILSIGREGVTVQWDGRTHRIPVEDAAAASPAPLAVRGRR